MANEANRFPLHLMLSDDSSEKLFLIIRLEELNGALKAYFNSIEHTFNQSKQMLSK